MYANSYIDTSFSSLTFPSSQEQPLDIMTQASIVQEIKALHEDHRKLKELVEQLLDEVAELRDQIN